MSAALQSATPVARIIISIALMLFTSYGMTRITKRLHLPKVTAYILAGILLGPFCLDLVPGEVVSCMNFVADIALAFIAFSTGEFFRLETLRRSEAKGDFVDTLLQVVALVAFLFLLLILTYLPAVEVWLTNRSNHFGSTWSSKAAPASRTLSPPSAGWGCGWTPSSPTPPTWARASASTPS